MIIASYPRGNLSAIALPFCLKAVMSRLDPFLAGQNRSKRIDFSKLI